MYQSYIIEPIAPPTIDKAYPLAKVLAPALLQFEWRQLCQSCANARSSGETERIIVALDAKTYVKGLCVYAIRNHETYGRVLDVPFFVTASAADAKGVASALVEFLRAKGDEAICSGVRFWTMTGDMWARRLKLDDIARSDHGLFLPALASAAEIENALCAHAIDGAEAIDRLSR